MLICPRMFIIRLFSFSGPSYFDFSKTKTCQQPWSLSLTGYLWQVSDERRVLAFESLKNTCEITCRKKNNYTYTVTYNV